MKPKGKKARGKGNEARSLGNPPKASTQPDQIPSPPSPALSTKSADLLDDLPPLPPSVPSTPKPASSSLSPVPSKQASVLPNKSSEPPPEAVINRKENRSPPPVESKPVKESSETPTSTPKRPTPAKATQQPNASPSSAAVSASEAPVAESSAVPIAESPPAAPGTTVVANKPASTGPSSPKSDKTEEPKPRALAISENTQATPEKPVVANKASGTPPSEAESDKSEEPKPRAPSPPPSTALQPPQRKVSEAIPPLEHTEPARERRSESPAHRSSLSRAPFSLNLASQPQFQQPFASRVPSEHYSTPPAPNYQPRFFSHTPPSAPSYYHAMSPPNGYMNGTPYPMQPHHASTPYHTQYGSFSSPFDPFSNSPPMMRHDSVASRGSNGPENNSAIEDDPGELFSRISSAIPDLHLLLSRYKETHGQLGLREELIRRAEMQQAETIKRKDDHIDHLSKELEAERSERDSEKTKHRLEVGNQDENLRECKDRIAVLERGKAEVEDAKVTLETDRTAMEASKVELEKSLQEQFEASKVEMEKSLQEQFETWKAGPHEPCREEKIALAVQFDKQLKEQEVAADAAKAKAEERFSAQKDEMLTEFQKQKQEIEAGFEDVRKEIESKLVAIQKDLEDALQNERENRESWSTEREELIKTHDQDMQTRQKQWDEQKETLAAEHKKAMEDSETKWSELHADSTKQIIEEKAKSEQLTKEKDEEFIKAEQLMKDKGEIQKSLDDEKAQVNLEKEKVAQLTEEKNQVQETLDNEKLQLVAEKERAEQLVKEKGELQRLLDYEMEQINKEKAVAEELAKGIDQLQKSLEDEKGQAIKEMEAHQQCMDEEKERFSKEKDELELILGAERSLAAHDKAERGKVIEELEGRLKEANDIQKQLSEEKTAHENSLAVIQSVASNLEAEKSRLEKIAECYGGISDIKSKGDVFYLDSFGQLSKQILDLSKTHFAHLPVVPPADVLSTIPPGLPSFLGDTEASRQLRTAYIAHTISSIITFRIFVPFLFSLGRRYDKADSLFTAMSSYLRGKSTRKEAVWRQHTLVAAFTSSGAKQRINSAAGSVVEEVVNAIKDFTAPSEEEAIRMAVRRIVKLAAETWRLARLEREMIIARFPAVNDQSAEASGGDLEGLWPAYTFDSTTVPLITDSVIQGFQEQPKMLLRIFPVIQREPIHESFRMTDEEKEDKGCIYSYGLALYDDANPVVVREEELRQAGLPQSPPTKSSPSATDFPPPTIPPPRNPLPPLPRTTDEQPSPSITEDQPSPSISGESSISKAAEKQPTPSLHSNKSAKSSTSSTSKTLGSRPPMPMRRPPSRCQPAEAPSAPQPSEDPARSAASSSPKLSTTPVDPPKSVVDPPTSVVDPPKSVVDSPKSAVDPPKSGIEPPRSTIDLPRKVVDPPKTTASSVKNIVAPPPPPPPPPPQDEPALPTPPRSRSGTPPSPLFPATDEIDGLKPHESRPASMHRRNSRPTSSRGVAQDVPRESSGSRRASGYTISNRSSMEVPGGKNWRIESRSAAIKGLYPDSPLAGSPPSEKAMSPSLRSLPKSERPESVRRVSTGRGEEPMWKGEDARKSEAEKSQK